MQLQETIAHLGVFNDVCRDVMTLMVMMLKAAWDEAHTCGQHEEEVLECKVTSPLPLPPMTDANYNHKPEFLSNKGKHVQQMRKF